MRRQHDHHGQGIFVAESEKIVRRLLESRLPVLSLLLPEKWLAEFEPLLSAYPEEIPVYVAPKEELEKLTGFSMYQGVLAAGKIPSSWSLEQLLRASAPPRLFVALDELSNAENIGVIVRNAVALGVQGLIVGETSSSPYLRRAVRSSMGTIFKLPFCDPASLVKAILQLRGAGVRCVAAHPHASGRTLWQSDFTSDTCIVLGSEGHGISRAVLDACDEAVEIPMHSGVDSLNVGSASAVFLCEVQRQRA